MLAFDAHAFGTHDPDTGLMTHVVADGVPRALSRAFVERIYPRHATLLIDMPNGGVPIFSLADHTPEVHRELRAHGLRSQTEMSFAEGGRLWGTWCVMHAIPRPAMTSRHHALVRRLAPHIVRGLKSAALIQQTRADRGASTGTCTPGVLVLDARHRPMLRSGVARAWLDDLADLGIALDDDIPIAIRGLAARLRATPSDIPAELAVCAHGRSGRWYTVRASLAEPDATGECATIVVVRPAVPRERAAVLTRLYDLSPREREVVAAVARGESTKCIAARLGVSPYTVTEHIERACDKIGVRGRRAIIAKLFFDGYAPLLENGLAASAHPAGARDRT